MIIIIILSVRISPPADLSIALCSGCLHCDPAERPSCVAFHRLLRSGLRHHSPVNQLQIGQLLGENSRDTVAEGAVLPYVVWITRWTGPPRPLSTVKVLERSPFLLNRTYGPTAALVNALGLNELFTK